MNRDKLKVLFPALALVLSVALSASSRTPARSEIDDLYQSAREAIHLGEFEKALRLSEQTLSAARQLNDRGKQAWALDLIGNVYFYMDRDVEALESFQQSSAMMREAGDRFGEATALKDAGITLMRLGRYEEGFEVLHSSLEIFRELNVSGAIVSALENIASGYVSLGAYGRAFEIFEQALDIAKHDCDARLTFSLLTRIGSLHVETGNAERALDYLRQALAIGERQKLSPVNRVWAMTELSIALSELGQIDAAIGLRRRSLALSRKVGLKTAIANNLQGLGHLYLDRDPALAIEYLKQSHDIFEQVDHRLRWSYFASLAIAYRRQGDLDRAIAYYEKAVARLESFRKRLASEHLRATFLEKQQQAYRELMESLIERHERSTAAGDDVRAFTVYEMAKARVMLDRIAEARPDAAQELEPDLHRRQKELNIRIAELQKQLVESDPSVQERRHMLERLARAEEEFDRLVVEIRQRSPRYAALHYPDPLTPKQIQPLLDERTALVAYSITKKYVLAFVLTSGTFHVHRLEISPDLIEARTCVYLDLIARPDAAGWRDISRRLYQDLLEPLRRALPAGVNRLVIVPDGVLHCLPFETLTGTPPDGGERFLLEDFVISYSPSASVFGELDSSPSLPSQATRADLLLFADPLVKATPEPQAISYGAAGQTRSLYEDEGLHITPIPFTSAEAEAVRRYARHGSEVYTREQASEQRVKSRELGRFRVIHFATHGLISRRAPARSALLLASSAGDEDGLLQSREIYQLKLASDLVVLSACRTARGRIMAGEGVQGLTQAFFYAGAKSVVASLWNVNDARTSTFMESFYKHLSSGRSKAEALRAAKLDLLSHTESSSPRYWAPFILIGEADSLIPISGEPWWDRNRRWLLVSLAFSLAALAALFLLKRGVK